MIYSLSTATSAIDIPFVFSSISHYPSIHPFIHYTTTGQLCQENTPASLCPAGYYCPDPATQITCPSGSFCPKLSTAPIACRGVAAGSCHTGAIREVVWVPLLICLVILSMIILPIHVFPMWLSPRWLIRARGLLRSGSKTSSSSSKSKKGHPATGDVVAANGAIERPNTSRPPPLVNNYTGGDDGAVVSGSGGDVLLESSKSSSVGPLRITIRFDDMMLVTGQTRRINGVSGASSSTITQRPTHPTTYAHLIS